MRLKIKVPNTIILLSSLIVITAALTLIIPAGEFARTKGYQGLDVVVPNSYKEIESVSQFNQNILLAPIKGFMAASEIIVFILFVGGAFYVFQRTEAIDSGIKALAKAHKKSAMVRKMLIPIFMVIFSLGGATFGMSEETIPFIMIFIPLALVLGYDTVTGVAIPFVGASTGFAAAFMNPFTIGIAQGIAGLPPMSGIGYRLIIWVICTAVAIWFVMRYAAKVKKEPKISITYEQDLEKRKDLHVEDLDKFSGMDKRHTAVLITFLIGILTVVFGVLNYGWYIKEICAVFLATGILTGIVGGLSADEISNSFIAGAKDLITTAFVVALSKALLIIASDGKIIDTILYAMSAPLDGLHPIGSSIVMLFVQKVIVFFVPSGSGQAALTMPVMAPLSDILGVSRQTAVLAFQFGEGFANMIIPTSAVTMGILALAKIPYEKWAVWVLPLEIIFIILACLLMIPPYFIWQ
ncbi:MAG: putative basic amino acid antiporter YfcC [Ignavibacteriales bacterium]|nr:putative basic amino acid antiporter YfcC [Ignavibacteriales bacterium]